MKKGLAANENPYKYFVNDTQRYYYSRYIPNLAL